MTNYKFVNSPVFLLIAFAALLIHINSAYCFVEDICLLFSPRVLFTVS